MQRHDVASTIMRCLNVASPHIDVDATLSQRCEPAGWSFRFLGKAVLTSTHNLMLLSRNKKNNVYPYKLQFYYINVGFKGSKLYRRVFVMNM